MSIVSTYRRYIYQLTAGVDFLRDGLGRLYAGTYGVVSDAVMEGLRQGFVQSLPGHPEQTSDSLDQVGSDRGLFKFRGESLRSWTSRVQNAWKSYEQAGTDIQVKRAINEWGAIIFPGIWDATAVHLVEGPWAKFTVWMGAGITTWLPVGVNGSNYDEAERYDRGSVYDLTNANLEDIYTLSRLIKKWKPERSRANVVVVLNGFVYDQPTVNYDAGFQYGTAFSSVTINVDS